MPKSKKQKQDIVDRLSEKLSRMKSVVFTSFSGFTMEDANKLKEKGNSENVDFVVTKKTLLLRALEQNSIVINKDLIDGSILTAIGYSDEVAPAKVVHEYLKDREGFKMVAGILEGKLIDGIAVKQLATLPGKQELLSKLVGSLNAPVSGFANVLAGNLRGLVRVLSAIQESKS